MEELKLWASWSRFRPSKSTEIRARNATLGNIHGPPEIHDQGMNISAKNSDDAVQVQNEDSAETLEVSNMTLGETEKC